MQPKPIKLPAVQFRKEMPPLPPQPKDPLQFPEYFLVAIGIGAAIHVVSWTWERVKKGNEIINREARENDNRNR